MERILVFQVQSSKIVSQVLIGYTEPGRFGKMCIVTKSQRSAKSKWSNGAKPEKIIIIKIRFINIKHEKRQTKY